MAQWLSAQTPMPVTPDSSTCRFLSDCRITAMGSGSNPRRTLSPSSLIFLFSSFSTSSQKVSSSLFANG